MLRIHIEDTPGTYSIPPDNPFFGSVTDKQEIFCFGLRNPFRDSFDPVTGTMYLGDVGQDTREEVDVQKATNPGGGEDCAFATSGICRCHLGLACPRRWPRVRGSSAQYALELADSWMVGTIGTLGTSPRAGKSEGKQARC